MDEFVVEAEVRGPGAIVAVTGEIDAFTAPTLRDRLLSVVADGAERLVVDLRKVTFIESVGLGTLVAARKRLGEGEKRLCIVLDESQSTIRRVFSITGLDQVFAVHASLEAAVEDCLDEPAA